MKKIFVIILLLCAVALAACTQLTEAIDWQPLAEGNSLGVFVSIALVAFRRQEF